MSRIEGMPLRARVDAAYDQMEIEDRGEVWISLLTRGQAHEQASVIQARIDAGDDLPLAGMLVAVKDNIDVAGFDTTAAAPTFAYTPAQDAPAVAQLRGAGALILGKTNLDQFATGLVGTRSPYGVVRHAWRPDRISGGSSSGSAVAVALGFVDVALGTDTAGSGRVPAAFHGLWGFKPSRGLVSTDGVVPACASLDCVTVFSRDAELGEQVMGLLRATGCQRSAVLPVAPQARGRLLVPPVSEWGLEASAWVQAFQREIDLLAESGYTIVERSISPFLDVAQMLYSGSFVAERFTAVGQHVKANSTDIGGALDSTVSEIILSAEKVPGHVVFSDLEKLARLRRECEIILDDIEAILTPTTTSHPSIAEVAADPVGSNSRLGRFTNFANLLDMAALAFPTAQPAPDGFGLMLSGQAGRDDELVKIAKSRCETRIEIFVAGAHLRGQPLHHELQRARASNPRVARTAPRYRLYALATQPPKPGLIRADSGESIVGELWDLPAREFGQFVSRIPSPLGVGKIELNDGSLVSGFLCESIAIAGASEITDYRSWVSYVADPIHLSQEETHL